MSLCGQRILAKFNSFRWPLECAQVLCWTSKSDLSSTTECEQMGSSDCYEFGHTQSAAKHELLFSIFLLFSTIFYCILLYSTVFYSILQYSTVFYCILLYSTVFYCILLYSTVFYCILQHSTVFYCILLNLTVDVTIFLLVIQIKCYRKRESFVRSSIMISITIFGYDNHFHRKQKQYWKPTYLASKTARLTVPPM